MAKLGKNQINFLARMAGRGSALIVGDRLARSLTERGCLRSLSEDGDSFYVVTSWGLRAVADAMDSGRLPEITINDFRKKDSRP